MLNDYLFTIAEVPNSLKEPPHFWDMNMVVSIINKNNAWGFPMLLEDNEYAELKPVLDSLNLKPYFEEHGEFDTSMFHNDTISKDQIVSKLQEYGLVYKPEGIESMQQAFNRILDEY